MTARNYNYDIIRMTAMIFVILIHSCGILQEHMDDRSVSTLFYGLTSLINTAVPLFVMLSGALLLGKEEPLGVFFRKRFSRILLPFLIWSFIVYLGQHLPPTWSYFWDFPRALFTSGAHYTYWFVYMIIVLYLMTPFLRLAMRDRTVGLWTGGLILALFLVHAVFPDIPFIKAIYFEDVRFLLSFVGGFLLVRHLEGKRWLGPVSLSVAILFYGIQLAVKIWHPLEFPFYVFTAFGLFGWMISWKPRKPRKVVTFLSETSYGIYLCHAAIISVFVRFAEPYLPVLASPLITGTFTLAASATLMWLCKKCKLNKILY